MTKLGFFRVAAAVPSIRVADVEYNTRSIIELLTEANRQGVEVITFPELSITGYSCGDLFMQDMLLSATYNGLDQIRSATIGKDIIVIVGCHLKYNNAIYNCAVVISNAKYIAVIPKTYIPNYNEFAEKRWFASASDFDQIESISINNISIPFGPNILIQRGDAKFAIEICEDLWTPIPPSCIAAINGANLIFNLSASTELIQKHKYLCSLIEQQSARCKVAYIYSSAGYGESTTDLVFAGNAIIAEHGTILAKSERFTRKPQLIISDIDLDRLEHKRINTNSFHDSLRNHRKSYLKISLEKINYDSLPQQFPIREISPTPFIPKSENELHERCQEIINIQTEGLIKRIETVHTKHLVVGISGGLDSTLALLVAVNAFDKLNITRKNIIGITMPGFGTTDRTYKNAISMMNNLGISIKEIPITESVRQHFSDIGQDENIHDITYENSQARERTQILMDYANKTNALVIGTGDLSELALGWCTYNGDHMSMYAVNSDIPKTLVRHIVKWFASSCNESALRNILLDVVATPISPELVPSDQDGNIKQKTEDLVGPYELHDFFLYHMVHNGFCPSKIYYLATIAFNNIYDHSTIKYWLKTFYRRFFNQQFKRSCMPDGPKVGSVGLSPRGDWKMPSDALSNIWLAECDKL